MARPRCATLPGGDVDRGAVIAELDHEAGRVQIGRGAGDELVADRRERVRGGAQRRRATPGR